MRRQTECVVGQYTVHINDEEQIDNTLNIAPTQEDGWYDGNVYGNNRVNDAASGMMMSPPRSSDST